MSRRSGLSPIRQQIMEYIVAFKVAHDGCSPSIRQMADVFERGVSVINHDLNFLAAIGKIERGGKGESRMIKVVGGRWIAPSKLTPSPSPKGEGSKRAEEHHGIN